MTAASEAELTALAQALRERNFEVLVVDGGADARDAVFARIPEGAEVHSARSKTLEDIGVADLNAALRRITEHVQPYEDERLLEQLGVHTALCGVLILERDCAPGHTTVILVREPVGV